MGPPPTPIDPSLESFNAAPAPSLALDQLLPPAPGPQQRPFYPPEINLAANLFSEGSASSMRPAQLEMNPSVNSHPDPWDSQRILGRTTQPQLMNQNYPSSPDRSRQSGPLTYWGTHISRSDSNSSNGRHLPDSGYYTQTHATASIYSGDLASNQEYPTVPRGMTEEEHSRRELQFGELYQHEPSADGSNEYMEEPHSEFALELICQDCNHRSKNKSEFT